MNSEDKNKNYIMLLYIGMWASKKNIITIIDFMANATINSRSIFFKSPSSPHKRPRALSLRPGQDRKTSPSAMILCQGFDVWFYARANNSKKKKKKKNRNARNILSIKKGVCEREAKDGRIKGWKGSEDIRKIKYGSNIEIPFLQLVHTG